MEKGSCGVSKKESFILRYLAWTKVSQEGDLLSHVKKIEHQAFRAGRNGGWLRGASNLHQLRPSTQK
jgi:hypothetical protein